MTDEERALLATEIMGWDLTRSPVTAKPYWQPASGPPGIANDYWHPDQNVEQAMMVGEALREKGWRVRQDSWPNWERKKPHRVTLRWYGRNSVEYRTGSFPYGFEYEVIGETLPVAISTAALAVAKAMQEKKSAD